MDKGIFAASSGGLLATKRIDSVANNLANVNTVGFKAERLISRQQEFEDTLASTAKGDQTAAKLDFGRTPGVVSTGTSTDFTVGPINYTGNGLDVVLRKPNQFFTVTTPQGEQLTRAGNFTQNNEGALTTMDGLPINGDGGPITLPPGAAKISQNGMITVNGRNVARVRVVEVPDLSALDRVGGTRFKLRQGEAQAVDNAELTPESVEMPNLEAVSGMVEMINASKAFEAYAKTAKTIDELNERAIRMARSQG